MLVAKYLSAGIALLILRNWAKKFGKASLFVAWFLIPILLTWLVSQKFQAIFFDRYLLYTIPAAMLLAASEMRTISKIVFVIVVALYLSADFIYFTHPAKIPFKDLAIYVKQTQIKGDLIINEDAGNHKLWESKYYGIPAPIYNPSGKPPPFFVGTALMETSDFIISIPKNGKRLGVITYKSGKDLETEFKGFKFVEEKSFGSLNFVWMKKI
ncbi:hypothetical protein COX03_00060 [Candidatus Woesebacteria bacterium CG22_combo_CG10-13_8_21_14_all_39_10]|uniref:Glycosyltransferase RgtA/B/C/D-like domain-containing protein n=2 Tax=Candidatus Woeseibacteriota TaxID=1752722 RepID=A0A2H0BJX7_9BACT|nr:MAG: hypothetical protein COX03_00060 [Candidatus Woesebacteria bacterium CG22_combo_CG10-13_8_21_14_all_39_10]PIZ49569.1 MAG: hypothetical protein COY29_01570 [Candidatus Woesebacteria bacterium CG_4_10_14_0_2_um_filter_39_14]